MDGATVADSSALKHPFIDLKVIQLSSYIDFGFGCFAKAIVSLEVAYFLFALFSFGYPSTTYKVGRVHQYLLK
jgi:hypothetical protein